MVLEHIENVNIKYYIKHSSSWQILFAEVCQCLNTINILQIALSLQNISIKHINIKINVYLGQPGFQKGDNINTNRTHLLHNLPERVEILGHAHIICIIVVDNRIICCQIFCDLLINSAFEQIFNVMQLILVKLSGILRKIFNPKIPQYLPFILLYLLTHKKTLKKITKINDIVPLKWEFSIFGIWLLLAPFSWVYLRYQKRQRKSFNILSILRK